MTGRGITNVTSAHKWFHICHQQPAVSQDVLAGMSNGGFDRRTLYRADLYLVEMFIAGCVTVKHSHGQNVSHIRWTSFGRFHLVEMFTVEAGRCLRCSPQDMSQQQKLHMGKMFITSPLGCGVSPKYKSQQSHLSLRRSQLGWTWSLLLPFGKNWDVHIMRARKLILLSICRSEYTRHSQG